MCESHGFSEDAVSRWQCTVLESGINVILDRLPVAVPVCLTLGWRLMSTTILNYCEKGKPHVTPEYQGKPNVRFAFFLFFSLAC